MFLLGLAFSESRLSLRSADRALECPIESLVDERLNLDELASNRSAVCIPSLATDHSSLP